MKYSMTRRNFLSVPLVLPFIKNAQAESAPSSNQISGNKSVIFIFFSGGIAHQETFIVKPDTIEAQRPVNGFARTSIPGMFLGADFPRMAQRANKLKLVHSFGHNNAGHAGGSHWILSSKDNREVDNGGTQTWPSYGAVASKYLGTTNTGGLPTYIRNRGHIGDGGAWLGKQYGPFDISGNGRDNIRLNVSGNILNQRQELLSSLDSFNTDADNNGLAVSMNSFGQQAFSLLRGNCNEVFDINREPVAIKNKYGNSQFGQQLLLARRLVENNVNFVNVVQGSWDFHSNIADSFKTASPEVDIAISALIDDIYDRGLQEKVLVVMSSEFGRTTLNNNASVGREHFAPLCPLVLSGGGISSGGIIGEADNRLQSPKSSPFTPTDLSATIFNHLQIPLTTTYTDGSGRPHFISTGRNIL